MSAMGPQISNFYCTAAMRERKISSEHQLSNTNSRIGNSNLLGYYRPFLIYNPQKVNRLTASPMERDGEGKITISNP